MVICIHFLFYSLVAKWRFVSRVEQQMKYIMKGFNELVQNSLLSIFDENELEVLILFDSIIFCKFILVWVPVPVGLFIQ